MNRRKQIEETLDKAREDAPLTAIIPRSILDHSGRTVATIGGIDDDREGRVVHQFAETMGFQSIFLKMVLEALKAKEFLSAELLFTHLKLSPVFIPERDFLLKRGLRAYVTGDYEAAIHFLVPQFEGAVRTLGELLKLRIYKPRPGGGLMLRVLDELLRDEAIERALGADPCLQFRTLLTDQRGFNVRNSVCHGDAFADTFRRPVCDWLIHALLYVGMIRERPAAAPPHRAGDP